jgi:serine/threonine-protein kinase RsbW
VNSTSHSWALASDTRLITPVVEHIVGMCVAAGFSSRHCRLNVPVAVTEALANAMQQGNGGDMTRQVTVAVHVSPERLVVEVTDEGTGFALAECERTPDHEDWLEREDGRGIFLMRQLMDRVENRCFDAGHLLRLILHRV